MRYMETEQNTGITHICFLWGGRDRTAHKPLVCVLRIRLVTVTVRCIMHEYEIQSSE